MNFVLEFTLTGQCTSGKNAVIVTRSGHRFPAKRFVEWRADMMEQLLPQLLASPVKLPLTFPVSVDVSYTAKDRLRRDAPGIIDAIWHLLEKAGVVSDDTFLAGLGTQLLFINNGVDKEQVGLKITIRGNYNESVEKVLQGKPRVGRKKKSGGSRRRKNMERRGTNDNDGDLGSGK